MYAHILLYTLMYNEEGMVKQWKKAVEEWRRHFARDLNEGGSSDIQGGREMSVDEIELLDEERGSGTEGSSRFKWVDSRNGKY